MDRNIGIAGYQDSVQNADACRAGATQRDIQGMYYAFLFFAPPWRALKRGFDLQMT
ncbi:hypothetical protein [Achromobacter sp.]|jgi:hypothetical protein|uniref:hypothetical protein n=1 Tax=Achromobacter sp. TaxID=134375 RepID=UPI0028A58AE8|nr:hypothetical protein [Achromobacter sp.]